MALTTTTTYPHYIRENATPNGVFPLLSGRQWENNERKDNGTKTDPFYIQTFDEETTRILRNYLSASGSTWAPFTD